MTEQIRSPRHVFAHRMFGPLQTLARPLTSMAAHWWYRRHPIFMAESAHLTPRPSFWSNGSVRKVMRRILAVMSKVPWFVFVIFAIVFFLPMLRIILPAVALVMLFISLIAFVPWLWRIPTVLLAAVPLAREVERRRWSILRSTPYSTQEIILALQAASAYRIRRLWMYVTGIRLVLVIILVTFVLPLVEMANRDIYGGSIALDWNAYIICLLFLVFEPFLDVTVDSALGILASSFSRSITGAMVNGIMLRLVLWSMQLLGLVIILPLANQLLTPSEAARVPFLALFGPVYGLFLGITPSVTVASLAVVVVLRVVGLNLYLWLAVRQAETASM